MDKNRKSAKSENIYDAMRLVSEGISIYKAAKLYNITRSTLWRRLKHTNQNNPGHKQHLSENDEKILLKYASFVANMGSPVTVTWLRIMAGRMAAKRLLS